MTPLHECLCFEFSVFLKQDNYTQPNQITVIWKNVYSDVVELSVHYIIPCGFLKIPFSPEEC